jgi:hypothetical protein
VTDKQKLGWPLSGGQEMGWPMSGRQKMGWPVSGNQESETAIVWESRDRMANIR